MIPRDNSSSPPSILATDLDGTLIPLPGNVKNVQDLHELSLALKKEKIRLLFITGRHLSSVIDAIDRYNLPHPDWIISDVGTTIYQWLTADPPSPLLSYQDHLASRIQSMGIAQLQSLLLPIKKLRLQEKEKQGQFKLSYYSEEKENKKMVATIISLLEAASAPYSLVHSIDPWTKEGLIDLLPHGVSKAYALDWWANYVAISQEKILIAGDSGNDLTLLTAGYRAILVGNGDQESWFQAERAHRDRGWRGRLYYARECATSGLLEGCRWFGLFSTLR